jgi:TetR/AcrR family transcriptional regulator, transcriptional repressor for nem operon
LALAVIYQLRERIARTPIGEAFAPAVPPLERLDRLVERLHAYQKARKDEYDYMPGCPFGNLVMEQATKDEALRKKVDGVLRSIVNHFRAAVSGAAIFRPFK